MSRKVIFLASTANKPKKALIFTAKNHRITVYYYKILTKQIMKTEYEKMLAGEIYSAIDKDLIKK